MTSFISNLIRRKTIDKALLEDTKLDRCLSTFDLTSLGVGSTLGAGIYVVTGQVAKDTAGPAVVLSFLVAAIASILAGLCYAEFGARVPKAGSAYVYSYVTVGEFAAFVIGWNLILEYVIGTSSVARASSAYFDSLIGGHIKHFLQSSMPIHVSGLSSYPDFFAFFLIMIITVMLTIGVKESTSFTKIFTCVNLLVVAYVIICGFIKADLDNWRIPGKEVPDPDKQGDGGFFPFGISGMLSGAATCFYAFVGFDIIATTGEEVHNPRRAIPVSIVTSLGIVSIAYVGVASVLTLVCPYYLLDPSVPLPAAFDRVGWTAARYIISVGAVSALSTSLVGAMFPLPRVMYAMADDGVIFRFLSRVHSRLKTPYIATIIAGILSGLMAALFDLKDLINMMSIGTLLAYTLVAESVLLLRYMTDDSLPDRGDVMSSHRSRTPPPSNHRRWYIQVLSPSTSYPTKFSMTVACLAILTMSISMISFCSTIIFAASEIMAKSWWAITSVILTGSLVGVSVVVTWLQPRSKAELSFKVPFVPLLPTLSIFINTYLMLKLPKPTWIRFGVWMLIGLAIYFGYGMRQARAKREETEILLPSDDSDIVTTGT